MARDDYINTMPRVLTHPIRCACVPSNYLRYFFRDRTKTRARVFKMAVHSGGTVVWPPRNWPKGASVGQLGAPARQPPLAAAETRPAASRYERPNGVASRA
ncbi:hypothetical protein MTO96_019005 [Rhipicephalus appendiculatus]